MTRWKPKAVLCVSAHWYGPGLAVTAQEHPPTIYDFGGFSRLQQIVYPAPGSPELCARVQSLLSPLPVELSDDWGFDHGCWTVLTQMLPKADVPVIQLRVDS